MMKSAQRHFVLSNAAGRVIMLPRGSVSKISENGASARLKKLMIYCCFFIVLFFLSLNLTIVIFLSGVHSFANTYIYVFFFSIKNNSLMN